MQNSPKIIGLVQAAGLALYVSLFAFGARIITEWLKAWFETLGSDSAVPMIAFLMAFVTSALICATIVFGYPTYLFLHDKKEAAIPVVLWTIAWLIALFAVGITFSFLLA